MASKFNGVIEGAYALAKMICHHHPSGKYLLFLKLYCCSKVGFLNSRLLY